MDSHWKAVNLPNTTSVEFMLLSRSNTIGGDASFDLDIFSDREWCFLNVMLIERDDDRVRRIAIGVIQEDAWVEAMPVAMLLKLE
jgi:hypothetical protein